MGQPMRPFVLDMRGIAPSKVVAGEPDYGDPSGMANAYLR
jgi:hypothetical protein